MSQSKFKSQPSFNTDSGIRIFPPNEVTEKKDNFYISYNPGFMSEQTTAIVIHDAKSMIFLSLKGNHKSGYDKVLDSGGLGDVVDYYIENISEAAHGSEHRLLLREGKLPGIPSAEEIKQLLGEDIFNKLRNAAQEAKSENKAAKDSEVVE